MIETNHTDFDVAIVGLGPVGCLGAILFAETGLKVVAIEREIEVNRLPRAVNLDGEIIRALQPCELAHAVSEMMQPIRQGERAGFANSKREWLFGARAGSTGSNGWQPNNMFHQPELDAFLRERVQSHPNVETYIGYELIEFTNRCNKVNLDLANDSDTRSLNSRYLVACDGANSSTRKKIGISWRDLGYDQDWLVVDVIMHKPHHLPNEVLQICDPDRIHTYVATKDPFRRWEFQLNPGENREQMLEEEAIRNLLDSWTPRHTYTICRSAIYQFHAAVAASWNHGRIFLAGDAAHQSPPFLGQGMNSGMRDVINLAWKLPLVIKGVCVDSLLETYELERRAHTLDLISWAVDIGLLMQQIAARETCKRLGEQPPELQKSIRKTGYGQGREQPAIRSGAVMIEQVCDEGISGYLFSQPMIRDKAGNIFRFDELIGSSFSLLSRGPVSLNEQSKETINAIDIKHVDISSFEVVAGKFPDLLKLGGILLLRPDKVVFGHTSDSISVDDLILELKSSIKVRQPTAGTSLS